MEHYSIWSETAQEPVIWNILNINVGCVKYMLKTENLEGNEIKIGYLYVWIKQMQIGQTRKICFSTQFGSFLSSQLVLLSEFIHQ